LPSAWIGLSLSGVVGFVVGDLLLFQAFVLIGARLSMLIYASTPAMTALGGYLFLGEGIGGQALLGMGITVLGIALAIAGKRSPDRRIATAGSRRAGIWLALGGAAGQAGGLLLAKHGAQGLDSFAATEVRVFAGLAGFLVVAAGARRLRPIAVLLQTAWSSSANSAVPAKPLRAALALLSVGALLGPFLGVSLGLLSAQLLPAGVASTLMSLVPVLLIPIAAVALRERISFVELAGTAVAFAGVVLMAI
jgi:drug/metabolite transporter (DMT)-like permease